MVHWCLGCDDFYTEPSDLSYTMTGGKVADCEWCGPFYVAVGSGSMARSWAIGAWIVIPSGVTFPIFAIP